MKTLDHIKTLSELIIVAVNDLEKCEIDPNYVVDMDTWHSDFNVDNHPCHVCLAGSVMAKTVGYKISTEYDGAYHEFSDRSNFEALNQIRQLSIASALEWFGDENNAKTEEIEDDILELIDEKRGYSDCPDTFKANMRFIASELKKIGL